MPSPGIAGDGAGEVAPGIGRDAPDAVRDAAPGAAPDGVPAEPPPLAVLLDRDGTLVQDVPYNGDPAKVRPMPGAEQAVRELRASGVLLGVVSNQSGIGRGLLTVDQVRRVNARVGELLGPFAVWEVCPHRPEARCPCRKPQPGLVLRAAHRLGVRPRDCVLLGDIGADAQAAEAAGARAVIVPTPVTRPEEYADRPTAPDLLTAARRVLAGWWPR